MNGVLSRLLRSTWVWTIALAFGLIAASSMRVLAKDKAMERGERTAPRAIGLLIDLPSIQKCDCSGSEECPPGAPGCFYGVCWPDLNFRFGVCKSSPGGGLGVDPLELPITAREAGGLFDALESELRKVKAGKDALAVARYIYPGDEVSRAAQLVVLNALDCVVDLDLAYEPLHPEEGGRLFATYDGECDDTVLDLLEATRLAVTGAIEANNTELVRAPIMRFWSQHPDFRPAGGNRCFPDGQSGRSYPSVAECQITELESVLSVILPKKPY